MKMNRWINAAVPQIEKAGIFFKQKKIIAR